MRGFTMCRLAAATVLALLQCDHAQIMSVDLGHEFTKVALMQQGKPLEIILNSHSKRKSTTAVSFFEQIRTFGDDALAHTGKDAKKVPVFFHSLMGKNFTSEEIQSGGKWWQEFALGDKFYPFKLAYSEERGVAEFDIGGENASSPEEILANILYFCQKMSMESADGKPVKDVVVTMPSDANLRQRQAVVAAGEIAGLRPLTLVHEGAAFAVQRAVDYQPEKGNSEHILFYNMGSRKTEVTIVKFESRSAGMVAGKTAPVVSVLGSAIDYGVGGHMMDVKIADAMLKKFQEKNPKLADGVAKNPRALRKILTQAQKTKAILSSNKAAPFNVESLYEDTDFFTTIQRTEFEEMCKDMFSRLTEPVDKALKAANVTLPEIKHIEVVGGAWRVPKVQQVLTEFVSKLEKPLPLGQHLNGEEAAALGAALVAANSSTSFRVKKIFFSDVTAHSYAVQVMSLDGSWEKNLTTLYPVGAPLGGKKKLSFSLEEDFAVRLFEDGVLAAEYEVTGVKEMLDGKWKEYNLTGSPKISASVPLEGSGIVSLTNVLATVEDNYWVNVTKEKPKANATQKNGTDANGTKDANASSAEAADDAAEEGAAEDASTNTTSNDSNGSEADVEIVQKLKKKKHEKKLKVTRKDAKPVPLSADVISFLKKKLQDLGKSEEEVLAVAGMKNELEAAIYGNRDKLERDDIIKVSTDEQREALTKLCTEYEEWMYETGATKQDYEQRLQGLQDLIGPIEERALEFEARSDVQDHVKESVDDMKQKETFIRKEMKWVNASKVDAAVEKLTEFEAWWKKKHDKQAELPLHEAPAFTKKEVQEKVAKIQKAFDTLKKIKKPKAPKAKKNETANGTKTGKDKEADAKLSDDPETVQKELDALRTKKAEAVENEDFDMAQSLKQKEKKLVEHLEALRAAKAEL